MSIISVLNPFRITHFLYTKRDLIWQFTVRTVELRHKGSHLGLIWSGLGPLLNLALYTFVFGVIFQGSFGIQHNETHYDYAIALFLGLAMFNLLAEVMGIAPTTIVSNPNFVKKVVFPLEILPVANVASSVFHFLITLILVLIGAAFGNFGLSISIIWLPIIIFPFILFVLGIAWILASVGVFFRDLNLLIQFLTSAILYASAVFYPSSKLSGNWNLLRLNPLVQVIELSRDVLLWHIPINTIALIYLYVVGLLLFSSGFAIFTLTKPAFADVL